MKPYREGGRLVLIHSFPKALSFENSGKYLFFFRDHNLILFFFNQVAPFFLLDNSRVRM